jgi:hypothetical protein
MPETIRMTATGAILKPRKSHIFGEDPRGHYVEPTWVSERLFEEEAFDDSILDPAVGWGRITTAAYTHGYRTMGCDIVNRHPSDCRDFRIMDFTAVLEDRDYRWLGKAGAIVTNPPFRLIREYTLRACSIMQDHDGSIGSRVTKVAVIFPVRRLPAASWLEQLPLARVLMLSPRPSMPTGKYIASGGRVGGGTTDFSWLIFQRDYKGQPSMGWLHRDELSPQN